ETEFEDEERRQERAVAVEGEKRRAEYAVSVVAEHHPETEQPEERRTNEEAREVLDRDVDRVLRSNEAALERGEPGLHEQDEGRTDKQPGDIDWCRFRHLSTRPAGQRRARGAQARNHQQGFSLQRRAPAPPATADVVERENIIERLHSPAPGAANAPAVGERVTSVGGGIRYEPRTGRTRRGGRHSPSARLR